MHAILSKINAIPSGPSLPSLSFIMAFLVSDRVGALNSNTGTSHEPEECEVADCTKDLAEELCPKTCSEHRSCKIADCTKPKSSKLCPKTCAKLSKDDSGKNE